MYVCTVRIIIATFYNHYHQYVSMSVCMYVCLYVSMSVCQYVSVSVCQYVSMSVCLYISMSVCQYVSMPVCQYVSMSVCLYVRMSVCQYVSYWHFVISGCFRVGRSLCRQTFCQVYEGHTAWSSSRNTMAYCKQVQFIFRFTQNM